MQVNQAFVDWMNAVGANLNDLADSDPGARACHVPHVGDRDGELILVLPVEEIDPAETDQGA